MWSHPLAVAGESSCVDESVVAVVRHQVDQRAELTIRLHVIITAGTLEDFKMFH